jgi:hypothetical protein
MPVRAPLGDVQISGRKGQVVTRMAGAGQGSKSRCDVHVAAGRQFIAFTPQLPHARFAGLPAVAVRRRVRRRGACGRDQQNLFAGR